MKERVAGSLGIDVACAGSCCFSIVIFPDLEPVVIDSYQLVGAFGLDNCTMIERMLGDGRFT